LQNSGEAAVETTKKTELIMADMSFIDMRGAIEMEYPEKDNLIWNIITQPCLML
jgi:hypothetical protein